MVGFALNDKGKPAMKGNKKMKRFLILATLFLILLVAWGCGNSDNILTPETNTENDVTLSSNDETGALAQIKSEVPVLAAPKNKPPKDDTKNSKDETNKSKIAPGGITENSEYFVLKR